MSSNDFHEVVMRWPYTDAQNVVVTGTFDEWKSSIRLERTPSGFEAPIKIPFGERILYKFIVDGRWVTDDNAPTNADGGFINNVYTAPEKPDFIPQKVAPNPDESAVSITQDRPELAATAVDAPALHGASVSEEIPSTATPVPVDAGDAKLSEQADASKNDPALTDTAKSMFGYAKGVAASLFPSLSPQGSRASTPLPAPVESTKSETVEPGGDSTLKVPIGLVPVAAPQEQPESIIVAGAVRQTEKENASRASTHIPLPPPGKIESAGPASSTPVAAPPILAAEPISTTEESPKEVVEAAPVAAVETAAAPTAAVETNVDELVAAEEKIAAPEIMAAPSPQAASKEVVPVTHDSPEPTATTELPKQSSPEPTPAVAEEEVLAPEVMAAPSPQATSKEVAPASLDPSYPAATANSSEQPHPEVTPVAEPSKENAAGNDIPVAAEPVKEAESGEATSAEPAKSVSPDAAAPAKVEPVAMEQNASTSTAPKAEKTSPSTPPPSNGHSRFGTLRSGSIRGKFRLPHRRASSQANADAESIETSPVASIKEDSPRKKRMSLIGKFKDVMGKLPK